MSLQNNYFIACPYCLEHTEVMIDISAGPQQYTEDCEVCCHPILFNIHIDGDKITNIEARKENE